MITGFYRPPPLLQRNSALLLCDARRRYFGVNSVQFCSALRWKHVAANWLRCRRATRRPCSLQAATPLPPPSPIGPLPSFRVIHEADCPPMLKTINNAAVRQEASESRPGLACGRDAESSCGNGGEGRGWMDGCGCESAAGQAGRVEQRGNGGARGGPGAAHGRRRGLRDASAPLLRPRARARDDRELRSGCGWGCPQHGWC
jgi:hypothetical protein